MGYAPGPIVKNLFSSSKVGPDAKLFVGVELDTGVETGKKATYVDEESSKHPWIASYGLFPFHVYPLGSFPFPLSFTYSHHVLSLFLALAYCLCGVSGGLSTSSLSTS